MNSSFASGEHRRVISLMVKLRASLCCPVHPPSATCGSLTKHFCFSVSHFECSIVIIYVTFPSSQRVLLDILGIFHKARIGENEFTEKLTKVCMQGIGILVGERIMKSSPQTSSFWVTSATLGSAKMNFTLDIVVHILIFLTDLGRTQSSCE